MKKLMKKIGIFILVILIFATGCKKDNGEDLTIPNKPVDNIEDEAKNEKDREKIMKEFEDIFATNDLDKILSFANENIGKLTSIEGDKMVSELQYLLEESIDTLTEALLSLDKEGELISIGGKELFFPEDKIKEINNESLRKEVEKLYNSKYKLINLEGQFYPIVDYEKLKDYNTFVTDELKDFINIKAKNSNEPMAIDGSLVISYEDLANRIIEVENYIKKYQDGQRYEEMLSLYRSWLGIYLGGLPNTPIEDYENKTIYKDIFESYKKTVNTKDSVTAFVVNKYIDIIEENKGIIDDTVKEKNLSLVNEALSLLETSK